MTKRTTDILRRAGRLICVSWLSLLVGLNSTPQILGLASHAPSGCNCPKNGAGECQMACCKRSRHKADPSQPSWTSRDCCGDQCRCRQMVRTPRHAGDKAVAARRAVHLVPPPAFLITVQAQFALRSDGRPAALYQRPPPLSPLSYC